ncbi:DUF6188 family protein [Catellatospora sichuanensis]|uniref:DUF6188 family protein n=1 Tax=Catellatospora sichuanensis TaxID=1969805 RepID=UPI0011827A7A|nr:DUF6188 family protein [Catellatospora sichuanensis]
MTEQLPALVEHEDRWILPFRGLRVTQILVDYAFGLRLDDVGEVRIAGKATLGWVDAGVRPETITLDPERQDVAAGLAVFNADVLSSVAFKSGSLRIEFSSGHVLKARPDPQYEAWTTSGPGGMLVVSLPGGELAVWSPRP